MKMRIFEQIQSACYDLFPRVSIKALFSAPDPWTKGRLLTAKERYHTAWWQVILFATAGNLLCPDELCIALSLRIGAKIYQSAKCQPRRSRTVDNLGLHAWASAEIFPGVGKVGILLICFRLLEMQRKCTYTKKKMANVTATVACSVFFVRTFYTEW